MEQENRALKNGVRVEKHNELSKVAEHDLRGLAGRILSDADRGVQTAITNASGHVVAVVGLNGIRYLPDPDPDPLDAILSAALEPPEKEKK